MPAMIVDGERRFGVDLAAFYQQEDLRLALARRGVLVPPLTDSDAAAEPALAYVNPLPDGSVRWIADCPSCRRQGRTVAQYVWLREPVLFCTRCANADLDGRWRSIRVPAERVEIERLLLERPDPEQRIWWPHQTLDEVRAENARLGRGGR